jgi:hypothetical protein
MLRPLLKGAVAEDLQVDQAATDAAAPKNKNPSQEVEAKVRAVTRCAGGHEISSDKYGGRLAAED